MEDEINPNENKISDAKAESQTRLEFTKNEFIIAARSDAAKFLTYATQRPEWLYEADANGWLPIHEAVRAGNTEAVSSILSLVEDKEHVNKRMGADRTGGNSMWMATRTFDEKDPMLGILEAKGGVSMAPIQKVKIEEEAKAQTKEENANEPSNAVADEDIEVNEAEKVETKEESEALEEENSDAKAESQTRLEFTKNEFIIAARSDAAKFLTYATQRPEWLYEADANGWLPIHEAVRAGNTEAVSSILSLVEDKEHVNKRMGADRTGGNSMWMATRTFDEKDPMLGILEAKGGVSMAPLARTEL